MSHPFRSVTRFLSHMLHTRAQHHSRTVQIVVVSLLLTLATAISAHTVAFAAPIPGVKTASDAIFQFVQDNAWCILLPSIGFGGMLFFGIGVSTMNRARGLTWMGGGLGAMIFIYVLAKPLANLILTAVGQQPMY